MVAVEISEEFDQCPCGQDIKEHCYIRNRLNGSETYVGNVCINRFIQIDTGNLFDGLKRIAKDLTANANNDLIEHAYRMGYLYGEKEYMFLKQTMRKRNLSTAHRVESQNQQADRGPDRGSETHRQMMRAS